MQRGFAAAVGFGVILVFLCDLAVVGIHVLDDHTSLINDRRALSRPIGPEEVKVVPGPGQAFVTGTADRLVADGAQVKLTTPFTVNAVERGVGRVVIEQALVGGKRSTITWDGGAPLPVSGGAGLDLGGTHVEVDGKGPVYSLDGAVRTFLPGTYSLGATVAVGTTGVAAPREGVQFTADAQTVLTTRGGKVIVHLDPQKTDLVGPGKLAATGKLKVQFPDRTTDAVAITFGEGPYRVTVEPSGDTVKVDAILQGDVNVK